MPRHLMAVSHYIDGNIRVQGVEIHFMEWKKKDVIVTGLSLSHTSRFTKLDECMFYMYFLEFCYF